MKLRRAVVIAMILAMPVVATTCNDSPSGTSQPVEAWLAIDMSTPTGDDGGLMLVISGGPVDSVRSSYPTVLSRNESTTSTRIVIAGNLVGGTVAEILVPDARNAEQYTATVVQVASRGTFVQRSVGGYSLTVSRPE